MTRARPERIDPLTLKLVVLAVLVALAMLATGGPA